MILVSELSTVDEFERSDSASFDNSPVTSGLAVQFNSPLSPPLPWLIDLSNASIASFYTIRMTSCCRIWLRLERVERKKCTENAATKAFVIYKPAECAYPSVATETLFLDIARYTILSRDRSGCDLFLSIISQPIRHASSRLSNFSIAIVLPILEHSDALRFNVHFELNSNWKKVKDREKCYVKKTNG